MSVAAGVDSTPAGWRVVFACFVSAVFSWGFGFYAHGIYLVELQKVHGWSTGLISSVITGHYVLGALLLPRIAEAIGRFGPRTVFLCGLAATGGSLLLFKVKIASFDNRPLTLRIADPLNPSVVATEPLDV